MGTPGSAETKIFRHQSVGTDFAQLGTQWNGVQEISGQQEDPKSKTEKNQSFTIVGGSWLGPTVLNLTPMVGSGLYEYRKKAGSRDILRKSV